MPTQTTVSGPFRTMRAVSGVHSPRGSSVEQTRIRVFIISESTRARSRRGGRYGLAGLVSSKKSVVRLRGLELPRGLQHRHWRPQADTEVGAPAGALFPVLMPLPRHQGQRAAARGTRPLHRGQNFGSLRFMTGTSWSQVSERAAAA